MTPIERFVYWIKERDSIRRKKEAGEPKPWTEDPILQRYRFCNVRRMDDKVSQWLLENWYKPNYGHPRTLVACVMARHFNNPEALEEVGFPLLWKPERIKNVLRKRKASGNTIFNGAYMVRGIGTADKTEMVIDHVCQPLVDNPPELDPRSMQRCVEALLPYWGLSDFMAGQIVADLRWAVAGEWNDRFDWAPPGPGSMRGLKRLLGDVCKDEFSSLLLRIIKTAKPMLSIQITRRLEAIDWQSCLCEFDKYERTRLGEGRPKQTYPGVA